MSKIKLDTIVNFTTQFASMINAKIPLVKVLYNLQKDTLDKRFSKVLKNLKEDVEKGGDFAICLSKYPEAFDSIYVNMVNAGMQSGKLDIILTQLSIYLKKAAQTTNKVKSALSYPKFMLFAMTAVMSLMLIKVIPMFEKMFNNSKQELPQLTQIVVTLSQFFRNNIFIIIVFIVVIYVSIKIYTQTTMGKKMMDKLKISIFIIGALNKKSSISKFIRTFGVLTISDVPLLKAIKLSKSSANNIYIEEKIQEVVLMIEQGYGIAEAFKQIQIFPDIIIQMITSGEEGGNLGELLIGSADYYDDQIDNELKSIIALINPIITIFMGLFIALLMMAIFMPIFQMGDMY
jgi:type II secretory pathway component PulF